MLPADLVFKPSYTNYKLIGSLFHLGLHSKDRAFQNCEFGD